MSAIHTAIIVLDTVVILMLSYMWYYAGKKTELPDEHTVHDFDKRFQAEDEGLLIANGKTFRWDMLNQKLNYRLF